MAELTHAGGIVMRVEQGAPRYLVVTTKSHLPRWIFPQGHIDPGETPERAAEREVLEETGVEAKVLESVGVIEWQKDDRAIQVEFFLMRYVRNKERGEGRRQRWCAYEEALELLSWDATRDLLRRAHTLAAKSLQKPEATP